MQTVSQSPKTGNTQAGNRNAADRNARAQSLRQTIDASLDDLAQAVDDVRASETFTRYLNMQAKFHRYSWCNTLLIASQRPDATQVAGFQTWKKLKRHVRKGERGIMIFAPCPFKRETTNDKGEAETVAGMFFRVVHVFDVAQTDGEALPSVDVPTVEVVADDLLGAVAEHALRAGVEYGHEPPRVDADLRELLQRSSVGGRGASARGKPEPEKMSGPVSRGSTPSLRPAVP